MRLVPCTEEYWEFVRKLRTDGRTSDGFVQQVEITTDQQRAYMSRHWQHYFIALVDEQAAGFVGSVEGDIRVCVHPNFQRRGVGKFLILEIVKKFPDAVARVKIDNEASHALFHSAGFAPVFTIYALKHS
jgi:ribosomal protein S18 acetylase RimI-like enzyme